MVTLTRCGVHLHVHVHGYPRNRMLSLLCSTCVTFTPYAFGRHLTNHLPERTVEHMLTANKPTWECRHVGPPPSSLSGSMQVHRTSAGQLAVPGCILLYRSLRQQSCCKIPSPPYLPLCLLLITQPAADRHLDPFWLFPSCLFDVCFCRPPVHSSWQGSWMQLASGVGETQCACRCG
jgi:hypothetical protein